MTERTCVAKITAVDGRRDEVLKEFEAIVKAARDEPGTLAYDVYVDRRNPAVIWFFERYADKESFQAHLSSEALASVTKSVEPLLAAPPELAMLELVSSAS
jgi:quinol monooxygenase YgiN